MRSLQSAFRNITSAPLLAKYSFNQFTQQIAREDFIIHIRRESSRSYITNIITKTLKITKKHQQVEIICTLTRAVAD
jgi:hypothetical protein